MGGKFEILASKQKACRLVIRVSQAACYRLEVLVGRLADP